MNILPHKSWHVRTKRNIARVRRDEAKAAEEEKERQKKAAIAAQEARTAVLRERASARLSAHASAASLDSDIEVSLPLAPVTDIVQKDGHVNFFQDVEDGKRQESANEEAEKEKKQEQEEYEKKIGYLVYLGQDSLEASKQKPWYEKISRAKPASDNFKEIKDFEKSGYLQGFTHECKLTKEQLKIEKFKSFQDPLSDIRKYLKTPGVSKNYEKASSSSNNCSSSLKKSDNEASRKKSKHSKHTKRKKSKKSKKKKHKKQKSSTPSESGSSTDVESVQDQRKRKKLEELRAERLEREREERRKADKLLQKFRGETSKQESTEAITAQEIPRKKQKYNSQFNPELARQNFDFS